jgi:hypothetical protein
MYSRNTKDNCHICQSIEGIAKLKQNGFLSDFVEIRYLMQIHILLRVGYLHQIAKFGERAKKRTAGVLQFPQ